MSYLEKPTGMVRKSKERFRKKQEARANLKKFKILNKDANKTVSLKAFE